MSHNRCHSIIRAIPTKHAALYAPYGTLADISYLKGENASTKIIFNQKNASKLKKNLKVARNLLNQQLPFEILIREDYNINLLLKIVLSIFKLPKMQLCKD